MSKSQTLSIRLDDRTRFLLDFIARQRGQSMTTVIERAVREAGDGLDVQFDGRSPLTWIDFWHPNEAVRGIKMLVSPQIERTYEEEVKGEFINDHMRFFFSNAPFAHLGDAEVRAGSATVLWPRLDEFVACWLRTRSTDIGAAAGEMAACLAAAGVEPPPSPESA